MATITGKTKVWLSQYSGVTPKSLEDGTAQVDSFYYSDSDMTDIGYAHVGEAEVTLKVFETKTIITNKVEALKEEAKAIRAEAHEKCVRIEEKIQNLLAITYEPQ
jgi:hypothetical protein